MVLLRDLEFFGVDGGRAHAPDELFAVFWQGTEPGSGVRNAVQGLLIGELPGASSHAGRAVAAAWESEAWVDDQLQTLAADVPQVLQSLIDVLPETEGLLFAARLRRLVDVAQVLRTVLDGSAPPVAWYSALGQLSPQHARRTFQNNFMRRLAACVDVTLNPPKRGSAVTPRYVHHRKLLRWLGARFDTRIVPSLPAGAARAWLAVYCGDAPNSSGIPQRITAAGTPGVSENPREASPDSPTVWYWKLLAPPEASCPRHPAVFAWACRTLQVRPDVLFRDGRSFNSLRHGVAQLLPPEAPRVFPSGYAAITLVDRGVTVGVLQPPKLTAGIRRALNSPRVWRFGVRKSQLHS